MVDNNLKFDIHVDYIKKKIQKRIGAMYRGSSLLPVKYRKMFANSLILPHFDSIILTPYMAGLLKLSLMN